MFPRHARGLLDLLLAALCLWTAAYHTPAGALVRHATAWVVGGHTTARPLLAYYDGVSGTLPAEALDDAPAPALSGPPARALTTSEALARGTHLALRGLRPQARQEALALAAELGIPPESLLDTARGPAVARRLHEALEGDFPDEAARLVALFAGRIPARYAWERVRAEGGALELERLAHQLPPGFEESTRAAAQALALSTAFGLSWPVSGAARVTSPFGMRLHPVLGVQRMHTGVDLSVPVGTPVRAVARGRVRRASEDGVNGRVLVLDHGHGVSTAYCHNSELRVRAGQWVERGELIAYSGNTGRSTGPHLHYQLELSSQPVDPLRFLAERP